MNRLPPAAEMAASLSNETERSCGLTFTPAEPFATGESLCARMFVLPVHGEHDINIVFTGDASCSRALGAAWFGMSIQDVTPEIAQDAISALLNVVAGQLTQVLKLVPVTEPARRTTFSEMYDGAAASGISGVFLRSQGRVDIRIWIFERSAPQVKSAPSAPSTPGKTQNWLRALARSLGVNVGES